MMPRLALLLAALLPLAAQAGTLSVVEHDAWVKVRHISDGDTFTTVEGRKVRLLGINTPEIAHPDKPAQPYGREATNRLRELIEGQTVQLRFDVERMDDYGRLLAQVWRRDGVWVNGEMVRGGFAHTYTFPPNVRWASELMTSERQARGAGIGIWQLPRFRLRQAGEIGEAQSGEFHVVRGVVSEVNARGFAFKLGGLKVSVPKKYLPYFAGVSRPAIGETVVVHGVIRNGPKGGRILSLHHPLDLERSR